MNGHPTWSTVALTGHRTGHMSPGERAWVRAELPRVVAKLRDRCGMTIGRSGMALCSDLWWAADLVDAEVTLHAHIPFPQQADRWPPEDRAEWARLRAAAAKVVEYGDHFDVRLLHARNAGMLRGADAVVAVYKPSKTTGGTAGAVRKAVALRLPFIHLNPENQTVTRTADPRRAV